MISKKEKKRKQHEKELKSLRNKMGSNIVWFDSLNRYQQFDFLFSWKRNKFINVNRTEPESVKIMKWVPIDPTRPWGRKKRVLEKQLRYPSSLKHFIKICRTDIRFRPQRENVRQTSIDILLKK